MSTSDAAARAAHARELAAKLAAGELSKSAAKRLKTDESSISAALPDGDDEGDIPESFKEAMAGTLMSHFGHGTFRPGQLSVLHALLGQGASGGRDACVFWATG